MLRLTSLSYFQDYWETSINPNYLHLIPKHAFILTQRLYNYTFHHGKCIYDFFSNIGLEKSTTCKYNFLKIQEIKLGNSGHFQF